MMSVGDTLRRERVKRNLQLEQVSKELKIAPRFLQAIEDERFEKLPGGVFAKAFVRQYSRLLGLNEEELASQVNQMLEPPVLANGEAQHAAPTGIAPIEMPRMEEWRSVGDRKAGLSGGSLSAAIVVVLVMLVCSGVYTWMQRQHNPVVAQAPAPAAAQTQAPPPQPVQTQPTPTPTQPAEQAPVAGAPATVQQQQPAATTPPAQTPATPPAQQPVAKADSTPAQPEPNPNNPVRIEITATEPVWVLARADGKFAFTGTMDANTKRSVDASKDIVLRLGNAGGVTITYNGQPIPPVGPKGQPRTVQFTSGGFHIVPAKPPSDSPEGPVARL
jgi:cytoskeleton protein RodZ